VAAKKGGEASDSESRDEKRKRLIGALPPLVTARRAGAAQAAPISKDQIADLRSRLGISQPVFAQLLNVSPETVRAWEQGKRVPEGAAVRLLELVRSHPQVLLSNLRAKDLNSGK
jgi:putative transcriptional regulator